MLVCACVCVALRMCATESCTPGRTVNMDAEHVKKRRSPRPREHTERFWAQGKGSAGINGQWPHCAHSWVYPPIYRDVSAARPLLRTCAKAVGSSRKVLVSQRIRSQRIQCVFARSRGLDKGTWVPCLTRTVIRCWQCLRVFLQNATECTGSNVRLRRMQQALTHATPPLRNCKKPLSYATETHRMRSYVP